MGSTAYLNLHYLLKAQHGKPVQQPLFFPTKADYIDRVRPPSWKQTKHNNKGDGAGKWGGAGRRKGTPLLPLPFLYFHPVVLSLRISFWLALTLRQFQHPRCRASVNFITRAAKFVRTAGYCTIKTSNINGTFYKGIWRLILLFSLSLDAVPEDATLDKLHDAKSETVRTQFVRNVLAAVTVVVA